MRIEFTKMQGLGNDFVLVDARSRPVEFTSEQIRRLADRRYGVGCDQVLLLEPPGRSNAHVHYRIFNHDGREVEQCGNGARCVARYLHENGLADHAEVVVDTAAGLIKLYPESGHQVRVNMGVPEFEPARIPLKAGDRMPLYSLSLEQEPVEFRAVSMGNPHAVLEVADVDRAPVGTLGPLIQQQSVFPKGVNVGFMQIIDRGRIRLRVYERGAGETLACGTGACAAVVTGIQAGRLDIEVSVDLPGGGLQVRWSGEGEPVWMTGPAEFVYQGSIEL